MSDNEILVPNFKLQVNGTDFSEELLACVEGVSYEDELNLPAMFTIKFNIVDAEKGAWRGIDLKTFKPGDLIKISMGADQAVEMMVGEITALDVTFGSFSYLELRGYNRLHKLRFGAKRRSFKDMKDSDIASSIASEAGLSPNADDSGTIHPYLFQNNQSNYEFLLERARRIDYEILVEDKNLIFRKSAAGKAPQLTLEYGVDLDGLEVQLRTLTEGSEVEVRGWDVKKKEVITATAKSGSETTTMGGKESGLKLSEKAFSASAIAITDAVLTDTAEAEKIAKAKYNLILKEFITAAGSGVGNPLLKAGTNIELKGIGDRFSGAYYIQSSVHSFEPRTGYKTTFKARRTGI
jgi:phage protein D